MNSPYRLFLAVTLPLAAFNLINQAARTVMAVIGPVLAVEFALSASELGMLAACMFAAYGAAQLPVGVALDMVGPRRVQAGACLLSAAGFAVFALAPGLTGFAVARLMLGVGISAALMAIIKANTQWFAPAQVANVTGLAMVVGSFGSVLTTAPVEAVLPTLGWRGVFWILCAASLATAAWIFLSVRDKPSAAPRRTLAAEVAVTARILGSRQFWRYAPAAAMLSVMNFAYLGLWAGPWLRDVAGYDGVTRAQTLLFYTIALMTGGWVVGWAGSRAQARGLPAILVPTLCSAGLVAAQLGLMLYGLTLQAPVLPGSMLQAPVLPALVPQAASAWAVVSLWALFAFCASGGPTAYIAVGQMFPVEQTARIATAINTLTLCGAFALQAAIGAMLDQWPRTAAGGWDANAYSAALAVSIAVHLAVAGVAAWGHCRRD